VHEQRAAVAELQAAQEQIVAQIDAELAEIHQVRRFRGVRPPR
jgi:hypothetical protein